MKKVAILSCLLLITSMFLPQASKSAEVSCALKKKSAYKSAVSANVYYITENCTKQIFPDESTFFSYFNSWSKVNLVDDLTLRFIPNDTISYVPYSGTSNGSTSNNSNTNNNTTTNPPTSSGTERATTLIVRDGSVIKKSGSGDIYLVINNVKFHIENMETLQELGIPVRWTETVSTKTFDAIPTGTSLNVYPNSKIMSQAMPNYILLKDKNSPAVYRVEPSSKDPKYQVLRKISNETILRKTNYRLDRLPSVSITSVPELNLIAVGTKTVFRVGTELTSNSTISYRGNYEEIIAERLRASNSNSSLRDEKYEGVSFEYPKNYKVVRGFSYGGAFRNEYSAVLIPPKDQSSKLYLVVSPLAQKNTSYTANELKQIVESTNNYPTGFETPINATTKALSMSSEGQQKTSFGYTMESNKELSNGVWEKHITFIYNQYIFSGLIVRTPYAGFDLEDLLYSIAKTFKKTN